MWTISHVHYQTQKHSKAMNRQSHEQSRKKVRSKHSSVLNMLFFLAFLSPHVASKWIERTKTKSKKKFKFTSMLQMRLLTPFSWVKRQKPKKINGKKNELETSWFMLQKEKKKSLVVTWCGLVYGMMRRITSSALRPVRYLSIEITTWMVYMSYICLL